MKIYWLLALLAVTAYGRYEPNWESLDERPIPKWYDEAKLGIFIHFGVFSVPSFGSTHSGDTLAEWFWWYWQGKRSKDFVDFMERNYPPGFTYGDFAPMFTAEFFNASEWAGIFKASGAKYIALTSKHHEGFCNWPSATAFNWNSMDVGPHRDIVGELANAIRNETDIKFGLYHSLYEWFNPLYLKDKRNNFTTRDFVNEKTIPELYDIVMKYKPELVWSDGEWEANSKYWTSAEFLAWLYNDSPVKDTVVTNDRWGKDVTCKHGGFLTCSDRYDPGTLQKRKWENAMTIDKLSWGFRRNVGLSAYLTIKELIQTFVETISCGGNMLMNVGPTKEGTIPAIYQERLSQMGEWLGVVGEAVYASEPWTHQNDSVTKGVWYTSKGDTAYAFFSTWPDSAYLHLGSPTMQAADARVTLLGTSISLSWEQTHPTGISVELRSVLPPELPNQWVWVLKLEGFQ